MKIYTNTTFDGHWPVGTAAVVRAENAVEAADRLNEELRSQKLRGNVSASEMIEFTEHQTVQILCDGNY